MIPGSGENRRMEDRPRHLFWLKTRRWTLGLLAIWFATSLLVPWFARDLDRYSLMGFPLGYWLAAEGALIVYVALIAAYVLVMDRLESALARHGEAAAAADRDARKSD